MEANAAAAGLGVLGVLLILLLIAISIASLICFVMVLVKMFQNNQAGLGIICILLTLCTGIGPLVAFVVGWIKAAEWNIRRLMTAWTVLFIGSILLSVVAWLFVVAAFVATYQEQLREVSPEAPDVQIENVPAVSGQGN